MLSLLLLFGLALGAVSSPDVKLQRGTCPMFWYIFNGRCYKYISTRFTWADAEFQCVSEGANLVSIHSADEENFVRSLVSNFDPLQGYTWIGLSDTQSEGRWMWSDGTAIDFTFWYSDQPNGGASQNCVHNNYLAKWNDASCSSGYPSVCATRINCP